MRLRLFLAAAIFLSASLTARASSIQLWEVSGDTYTYSLEFPPNETIGFLNGDTLTLSGLSGVTGAQELLDVDDNLFSIAFTSTSVTVTYDNTAGGTVFGAGPSGAIYTPFFSLTSAAPLEGLADFTITGVEVFSLDPVEFDGQVQGPVAAATVTPEPSSLILLTTGLLGLIAAARRRLNPQKLALLAALVAFAAFSHPLLADTVYTYTGNDFTSILINPGPYTTSDSITGSFTVASPLPDSLSLQQVAFTSYSFTDGVQTMNNLNSTFLDPILNIATDSHGNILYWDIELNDSSSSGLTNDFIDSVYYPPTGFDADLGQLAPTITIEGYATNSDVGTWTSATVNSAPPGVTPEPSSLILLGTGLLGLIGAARRRLC